MSVEPLVPEPFVVNFDAGETRQRAFALSYPMVTCLQRFGWSMLSLVVKTKVNDLVVKRWVRRENILSKCISIIVRTEPKH